MLPPGSPEGCFGLPLDVHVQGQGISLPGVASRLAMVWLTVPFGVMMAASARSPASSSWK